MSGPTASVSTRYVLRVGVGVTAFAHGLSSLLSLLLPKKKQKKNKDPDLWPSTVCWHEEPGRVGQAGHRLADGQARRLPARRLRNDAPVLERGVFVIFIIIFCVCLVKASSITPPFPVPGPFLY
jgi:hypothetical protein